jgi:glutamyl-tRNA reductase
VKDFRVLKVSYKQASLELRESVSFGEFSAKKFMVETRNILGIEELLVLSTCNRTEIYYTAEKSLKKQLCALLDVHQQLLVSAYDFFTELEGKAALTHLFRVALGLESQVLGENQIINQVKKSYQWSADENMSGPFFHRLLHTIFFTNKRIEQETGFRDGNTSTSSLAVDLVKSFIPKFDAPKVLVIGLGEIGRVVVDNMKGISAEVTLVNRTRSKAEEVAVETGFKVGDFTQLDELVKSHHVIVASATSQNYLITPDTLAENGQIKLIVDLGLPRNVDPVLEKRQDLLTYNVDQLSKTTNVALEERAKLVPSVEAIISEALNEFSSWSLEMEVSPTIKKLKLALEEIRKTELARHLQNVNEEEARRLEVVTKNMIQRVIKLPVLQLKAACKRGEAETLIEVLNDLFNLEKEKSGKK